MQRAHTLGQRTCPAALPNRLKTTFYVLGFINLALLVFTVPLSFIHALFRYGLEFREMPQTVGSRQFTNLAKAQLREFNEYPHNLERRCVAVPRRIRDW